MAATTTIRIEDELKERVTAAAAAAGKSAHAFILDAITESVERAEEDAAFHRLADERWAEFGRTGMAVPWEDVKAWLEAVARGEEPAWPESRRVMP